MNVLAQIKPCYPRQVWKGKQFTDIPNGGRMRFLRNGPVAQSG